MKEVTIEWVRFKHLVQRGLDSGKLKPGVRMMWDSYGSCTDPIPIILRSAPPPAGAVGAKIIATDYARWLEVGTRCRKCEKCRNAKAFFWSERAMKEIEMSTRTWFCTYTFRPEERLKVNIAARRKSGKEDYSAMSREVGRLFTKYLKRLRKNSGVKFRYLLALEPHKDGFPHVHALLHEGAEPLRKLDIQLAWPYGFTNVKIADPLHSRYVTKYLAKTEQARVRASLRYGDNMALAVGSGAATPFIRRPIDEIHYKLGDN